MFATPIDAATPVAVAPSNLLHIPGQRSLKLRYHVFVALLVGWVSDPTSETSKRTGQETHPTKMRNFKDTGRLPNVQHCSNRLPRAGVRLGVGFCARVDYIGAVRQAATRSFGRGQETA